MTDWDFDGEISGGLIQAIIPLTGGYDRELDGDENRNEALLGAAFPVGTGRLAFFLNYINENGNYDGNETIGGSIATIGSASLDFDEGINSGLDDFTLRMIYGVPLGSIDLGFELALGYTNESKSWDADLRAINISPPVVLPPIGLSMSDFPILNLLDREIQPYDSDYWNLDIKLGIADTFENGISYAFTPRFSWIIGGNNDLDTELNASIAIGPGLAFSYNPSLEGDVDGYDWGLDFWLRFPISDSVSMPFLFRVDYKDIERTASGAGAVGIAVGGVPVGSGGLVGWDVDTEDTVLNIEIGGGVDVDVSPDSKLAFGVYYNYIDADNDYDRIGIGIIGTGGISFGSEFADYEENQVKLKLAGETAISETFVLRGGINWFYGWVDETYSTGINGSTPSPLPSPTIGNTIVMDGDHWGLSAAIGASIKLSTVTIEPYINGGYEKIDLSGDEDWDIVGINILALDTDRTREEWFIGAGFSVLFDL